MGWGGRGRWWESARGEREARSRSDPPEQDGAACHDRFRSRPPRKPPEDDPAPDRRASRHCAARPRSTGAGGGLASWPQEEEERRRPLTSSSSDKSRAAARAQAPTPSDTPPCSRSRSYCRRKHSAALLIRSARCSRSAGLSALMVCAGRCPIPADDDEPGRQRACASWPSPPARAHPLTAAPPPKTTGLPDRPRYRSPSSPQTQLATMSNSTFDPNNAQNLDDVRALSSVSARPLAASPATAAWAHRADLGAAALPLPHPCCPPSDREVVRRLKLLQDGRRDLWVLVVLTLMCARCRPSQVRRRRRRAHGRESGLRLPPSDGCTSQSLRVLGQSLLTRQTILPRCAQTYEKLISQIPPRKLSLTKCVPSSSSAVPLRPSTLLAHRRRLTLASRPSPSSFAVRPSLTTCPCRCPRKA